MEEDDLLGEEHDLRKQLLRGPRNMGEGSKGRRMDGASNRAAASRDQDRFHPGRSALGNRPEASRNQAVQGEWNQGQGGRFNAQQGGWYRNDQHQAQGKGANRDQAIVLSEGTKANPNPDIKCFRYLGTGHFQADCTNEPICYKCKAKGHMALDCKSE